MSYIKNSLIIFMLCYCNFLLNDDTKKIVKSLIEKKLRKYNQNIEQINNLIELSLSDPTGIRNNEIDFKEKANNLYQAIEQIDNKELEQDINSILKKIKNIKSKK